jgi:thiamine-monophosphate kinase
MKQGMTLRDLGERRIVEELIAPRFKGDSDSLILGIGDDCAVLSLPQPDEVLTLTTDPCPTPVACLLGETDLFHYGWMTVLINVSDLAAMGARPLGLLVSTVMTENMIASDYERFLEGLSDASRKWDCPIIGGNIKDGPGFTATGSCIGAVRRTDLMVRSGAIPGDRVFVVGEMGIFWASVLRRLGWTKLDEHRDLLDHALLRPQARLAEGRALAATRAVTACMDSSDGVIGCLQELALKSHVDVIVDADKLHPHPAVQAAAADWGVDYRKLMLSWGDWQLVFTSSKSNSDNVAETVRALGTPVLAIGSIQDGTGRVWLNEKGVHLRITNFSSERFSGTSFFTHGIEAYLNSLKTQPFTEIPNGLDVPTELP